MGLQQLGTVAAAITLVTSCVQLWFWPDTMNAFNKIALCLASVGTLLRLVEEDFLGASER